MGRERRKSEKEDGAHVEAEEFVDVGDDVMGELLVVVAGEHGDDGDADVSESKFDEEGEDGDEDDEKEAGQLVDQAFANGGEGGKEHLFSGFKLATERGGDLFAIGSEDRWQMAFEHGVALLEKRREAAGEERSFGGDACADDEDGCDDDGETAEVDEDGREGGREFRRQRFADEIDEGMEEIGQQERYGENEERGAGQPGEFNENEDEKNRPGNAGGAGIDT